jgi:hypothetical protein
MATGVSRRRGTAAAGLAAWQALWEADELKMIVARHWIMTLRT